MLVLNASTDYYMYYFYDNFAFFSLIWLDSKSFYIEVCWVVISWTLKAVARTKLKYRNKIII